MSPKIGKSRSFRDTVSKSRPDCIFLVLGKDATHRSAWYYVRVDNARKKRMASLSGSKGITITDYGEILFSGYGTEVPQHIRDIMREKYGYAD
jgi:hypothetical protein